MKLHIRLTLNFILPIIIGLLIMIGISLTIILITVPNYRKIIEDKSFNEEIKNLNFRLINLNKITYNYLSNVKNDVNLIADYSDLIFKNKLPIIRYYPNYFGLDNIIINNLDNSVWYNHFNYNNSQLYLNESSILDNVWRVIWKSNPNYQNLYIGFETGLFRSYPHRDLSSYQTFSYNCYPSNNPTIGFDPRCRSWYVLAKNNNDIIFTDPYIAASSRQVLISVAKKIFDLNNSFIGAVSVNILMDSLENLILTSKILDRGYTFIIDNNNNAIVYPNLQRDRTYSITELEFRDNAKDANNFLPILEEINKGEKNSSFYNKNNESWYIIYNKINDTNYTIVMVVPNDDLIKPSLVIKNKINNILIGCVISFSVIILINIILGIIISYKISQKIVDPIKKFNNVTDKINSGNYNIEMHEMGVFPLEIKKTYNDFNNLVKAVQFANIEFYKNNLQEASNKYYEIEKMLKEIKNKKGLGVVWNNLGNILRQMKKIKKSEEYFLKSIENAKELNLLPILANRYMNLGLLYLDTNDDKNSEYYFKESIKINRELNSLDNEIKAVGNYCLLLFKNNRYREAEELINDNYSKSKKNYIANKSENNIENFQYALYNKGILLFEINQYEKSFKYFQKTLLLHKFINLTLKNNCLYYISEIYKINNMDISKIQSLLYGNKQIIFVLDISGSMKDTNEYRKISSCKQSISNIIDKYMNENDYITLITFNENIKYIINDKKINKNKEEIYQKINNITTEGKTAFYDALSAASNIKKNDNCEKWIISLTDGEDNSSKIKHTELPQLNNIIIITVGELANIQIIKGLCSPSNNGFHLQSGENEENICEAFSKAINIIQGQVIMEVL